MIPWWVSIYLVAYLMFAGWAFGYEVHADTEPVWYLILQGTTDFLLVVVGVAYWNSQLHMQLAPMLIPIYALSVVILCWQIIVTLRRRPVLIGQRSLSATLFSGALGALLWGLVSAPLVYWGFRAAILAERATGG